MGAADEQDPEDGEGWLTKAGVREIWPQIRPGFVGLFFWGLTSPDNHGTVTGFVR
ncbi:hypothetical protein [Streptomyces sp. NPDC031705]|uniref:hypothetical protein n=1 Tax=Streptomyces sp. NPDC031705 TaxID=3155729 RepID=UPI0033C63095